LVQTGGVQVNSTKMDLPGLSNGDLLECRNFSEIK
jgi:hypothetical protein